MIIYMEEKVNHICEYRCKLCNRLYASASSLCNHTKKFHSENVKNVKQNVKQNVKNVKSLTCEYCNKVFNNRPAKSIHKKNAMKIEILKLKC